VILLPAIDLLEGKAVRLVKGDRAKATVYSNDPALIAGVMAREGARWIHVVDLDAAFGGRRQRELIASVARAAAPARLEVGGGLRTLADIAEALESGAARAVLGTAARELAAPAAARFGAERIAVALDQRGGTVVARGWTEEAQTDASAVVAAGVRTLEITAVLRDGTMEGPDLEALKSAPPGAELIYSGGIGTLDHLRAVKEAGCTGCIVGRALYEGAFTLREALAACA
jgi:phosphoribosylformimino-5-aminoimidazole carboxamide ribotide isomerase